MDRPLPRAADRGRIPLGGVWLVGAQEVAVQGSYAYVADGYSGLAVVDAADPASPRLLSQLFVAGARGVDVAGDCAYLAAAGNLMVCDVSNPDSPELLGGAYLIYTTDVCVRGHYAYVVGGDGLDVVDVADPTSPVVVARAPTPGQSMGLAISDGYAYVAAEDGGLNLVRHFGPDFADDRGKPDDPATPRRPGRGGERARPRDRAGRAGGGGCFGSAAPGIAGDDVGSQPARCGGSR